MYSTMHINHAKGGFVQVFTMNGKATITACLSFQVLGTYKTVGAAKSALTRWHKAHPRRLRTTS